MNIAIPKDFPVKAMILAAGRGTRMRQVAPDRPKPMVEVGGRSLIDRALDMAQEAGITHTVVNIAYLGEMIARHLAKRRQPAIRFSHESEPLETGGGILHALPLLGEGLFFAINSDVICLNGMQPALHRLARAWDGSRMDALLLLCPLAQAHGYSGSGDFFLDGDRLRRKEADETTPYVFTGIQLLHPRFFAGCPDGAFSLNLLWDRAAGEEGWMQRICGLAHDGKWLHVGDRRGLEEAEKVLAEKR